MARPWWTLACTPGSPRTAAIAGDDPGARLDRELGGRVGAHEAVAEELREPGLGPTLTRHDGGELVNDPHGGGVADAVGVGGEVLEVAEQERDLDRGGRPGDGGGDRRLAEGDLGELPLEPAAMHGGEHDVGDRKQLLDGGGARQQPRVVVGVLTQIRLEHAHPQLHRAVGDPGEQPAVDAPELDRDVERPRLAQLPERHERVGLLRA